MTHPEEFFADYVSGSLSTSNRAIVDTHLASCSQCSAEIARAQSARGRLRRLREVAPPAHATTQALGAAAEPEHVRAWHRGASVAAAAAVLVAILVSVPHLVSGPTKATRADTGAAVAGGTSGGAPTTPRGPLRLTVEEVDYDQARLDALTTSILRPSGASPGGPSISTGITPAAAEGMGTKAELSAALTCVGRAVPPDLGKPFKLVSARYEGKPSYLAFYYAASDQGAAPTSLVVWIVNSATCTASGLDSTHI
jgi:hypothetical protein